MRAELEAAREETERTVEAERAETARLRAELASHSAPTNGGEGTEAEAAATRMYERIARELESERSAARHLRRELDAVQAQTAEDRRSASAAAAGGVTEEVPAATPAARRRSDLGRVAEPELPPRWKDDIMNTTRGRATKPQATERGVELIAICDTRTVSDDQVAAMVFQEKDLAAMGKKEPDKDFLAKLKEKATIVRR